MAKIIDGRKISEKIQFELLKEVELLKQKKIVPKIVIIQVGNNLASNTYIKNKQKLCEKNKIDCQILKFDEQITQDRLLEQITQLNKDKKVNGILVQLPLPKQIDEQEIISAIIPNKDVDCFNLENIGKLWSAKKDLPDILPCTPAGIIQLLKYSKIPLVGKNVVIVGRSNIVGKPLASLFLLENSTVTICHSQTKQLAKICQNAQILICAIGKAKFINKKFVNSKQTIIDVGMNRDVNGKLCGDVDFDNVVKHVYAITPVPGGVGPMTITMLLRNLIYVTKMQNNLK